MILDKNNKKIVLGSKVKNLDTGKTFVVDKLIFEVLHHAELLPQNYKKTWIYSHLERS